MSCKPLHFGRRGIGVKHVNKERKLLSLYSQGITNPYELSQRTGYAIGSIQAILYQNGIRKKRPNKNYKKTERNILAKAILFELLTTDKTASQIAREYGVSRQYVSELYKKEIKEK
jgi:hypothetical protein